MNKTMNKSGWSDYPGLDTLARLRDPISDYQSPTAKRQLHRNGLSLAAAVARLANLEARVFSNKAGPAVAGEVVLHSAGAYMQVCESLNGNGVCVMWRRPKDRTNSVRWDSDGANKWIILGGDREQVIRQLGYMVEQFRRWETEALTGGAA